MIEREPGDVQYLFKNYVAILALIPAVAGFIGSSIVGVSTPVGTIKLSIFVRARPAPGGRPPEARSS